MLGLLFYYLLYVSIYTNFLIVVMCSETLTINFYFLLVCSITSLFMKYINRSTAERIQTKNAYNISLSPPNTFDDQVKSSKNNSEGAFAQISVNNKQAVSCDASCSELAMKTPKESNQVVPVSGVNCKGCMVKDEIKNSLFACYEKNQTSLKELNFHLKILANVNCCD